MDFGKKRLAAIGERELLHIVYQPRLHRLPQAESHCDRVMAWEGGFLPVWDLAGWFHWKQAASSSSLIAVVGYASADTGRVQRGALSIPVPPKRISVRDEDAAALPDHRWERIANSCFLHEAIRVPTLDLVAMFDGPIAGPGEQRLSARAKHRNP